MADYYPLTDWSDDPARWLAFQFHDPAMGGGIVQAFCGAEAAQRTCRLRLRGLDPDLRYTITDWDDPAATTERSGAELAEAGIEVRAKNLRSRRSCFSTRPIAHLPRPTLHRSRFMRLPKGLTGVHTWFLVLATVLCGWPAMGRAQDAAPAEPTESREAAGCRMEAALLRQPGHHRHLGQAAFRRDAGAADPRVRAARVHRRSAVFRSRTARGRCLASR